MSAKFAFLIAVVLFASLATGGCARLGLARFAPPGTIKYEDLAQGQPVNPEVAARIEARLEERVPEYPNLSELPWTVPEGMDEADREDTLADLLRRRDAIATEVEEARKAAAAERDPSISGN